MTRKSETLLLLESLVVRMGYNEQVMKYLSREKKGHHGESLLWELLLHINPDHLVISDLYFETHDGQKFQIDHLMVIGNILFVYEVKNYEGDWEYGDEQFTKGGNFACPNPLLQSIRTKNCFKQLLQDIGIRDIEVKAAVVFVNSNFTLFNAPAGKAFILPTQLQQHFRTIDQFPPITDRGRIVAKELLRYALKTEPFRKNIPCYYFEDLKKGIRCSACGEIVVPRNTKSYQCYSCNSLGDVSQAIKEAAQEYQRLFPERKLTVNHLRDWCGKSYSKQRFSHILRKNFKAQGKQRGTYYL